MARPVSVLVIGALRVQKCGAGALTRTAALLVLHTTNFFQRILNECREALIIRRNGSESCAGRSYLLRRRCSYPRKGAFSSAIYAPTRECNEILHRSQNAKPYHYTWYSPNSWMKYRRCRVFWSCGGVCCRHSGDVKKARITRSEYTYEGP